MTEWLQPSDSSRPFYDAPRVAVNAIAYNAAISVCKQKKKITYSAAISVCERKFSHQCVSFVVSLNAAMISCG